MINQEQDLSVEMDANLETSEFKFLDSLDVDDLVKSKLTRQLTSTIKGSDDVLMTPMAKDHGPDRLLSEWSDIYEANEYKLNSVLKDLELSNKAKIGPRSIAKPWSERREGVFRMFDKEYVIGDPLGNRVLASASSNLRPVSLQTAINSLKNNTNSGLPYLTKKGVIKHRIYDNFESLIERSDPCVLFTRTQELGKTRTVWGYPVADTTHELQFYLPFLGVSKRQDGFSAINGPEAINSAVSKLIDLVIRSINLLLMSSDFEAYDESLKSYAQGKSFDVVKRLFQPQYADQIDEIAHRFNTIGLITPEGVMTGKHSLPSGSGWTNAIGSQNQVNLIKSSGCVIPSWEVQGDDGVYAIDSSDIEKFTQHVKLCGFKINETKSYVSKNYAIYLQNLFHDDYRVDGIVRGIYPIYRALNRLMYQERWSTFEDFEISGKDYYSIRTICIVENCKYHPLFKQFVKFVHSMDKYSLDVSDQGIRKYVQMLSKTQGAGEILNHQYGDNVSGIRSFETFKMIKELG